LRPNRAIPVLAALNLFFTPLGPIRGKSNPAEVERVEAFFGRQSISLRIYRNFLPVAEGQVGGVSGNQNFILDTGTAPSILSAKMARRLGLPTHPSSFTALGKAVPMEMAVVPEIALGPISATSLPVQVQDLSRLEQDLGIAVAGIIGMDVLSKASFRLDYDRKVLEFGESSREGIRASFDPRLGFAMINVVLEGRAARLLVDTGSDEIVFFGGNFAERKLQEISRTGTSLGDRKIAIQKFPTRNISVAERQFQPDAIYYVPARTDPVFDGLLGVRALGFCAVSYDQASKTVYLQN
jgi:predicted aspartyl protease